MQLKFLISLVCLWICVSSLIPSPRPASYGMGNPSNSQLTERSAATSGCLISPKNNDEPALVQRLEGVLKGMTGQSNLYSLPDHETNKVKWWIVDLTDEELENLKKNPDVGYAGRTIKARRARNATHDDQEPLADAPFVSFPVNTRVRRDDKEKAFDRQEGAPTELVMISVPPEQDMCFFTDYVFPISAGKEVRIFHIEDGIPSNLKEEFPPDRVAKPLKTPRYHWLGDHVNKPDDHSTCAASKAMGTEYGAGKQATLVPVLTGDGELSSIAEGLLEVKKELTKPTSKRDASPTDNIVLLTGGTQKPFSEIADRPDVKDMRKYIEDLFNLGVPVVAAAGNEAKNGRPKVDAVPAVWASDDFPLIVVGNADYEGQIGEESQQGDQVTLYACGTDISCQGVDEEIMGSGTSFAAPTVAGVLATFMSQKSGKFYDATKDVKPFDFVKNTRKFLIEKANWERVDGVRFVWNLVT